MKQKGGVKIFDESILQLRFTQITNSDAKNVDINNTVIDKRVL